jgi:hypothetical protein
MTDVIRIGEAEYAVSPAPEDLERQLRASSGIGVEETRTLLRGDPLPSAIARALIPFLVEAPPMPDLANAIDLHGKADVLHQARSIYHPPKPRKKKAKSDAGK